MFRKKIDFCFLIDLYPWMSGENPEAGITYLRSVNLLLYRLGQLGRRAEIRFVFCSGNTLLEHKDHREGHTETEWCLDQDAVAELTIQSGLSRCCTFTPLFEAEKMMRARHAGDPETSYETHYFWVSGSGLGADSGDRKKLAAIRVENSVHLSAVGLSSTAKKLTRRNIDFTSWQDEPGEIRSCFGEIYRTVEFLLCRFENSPLRRHDGHGPDRWLMA